MPEKRLSQIIQKRSKGLCLDKERMIARVSAPEDQLSMAIGKDGQNVRLTAKLTGYRIEVEGNGELTKIEELITKNEESAVVIPPVKKITKTKAKKLAKKAKSALAEKSDTDGVEKKDGEGGAQENVEPSFPVSVEPEKTDDGS